MSPVWTHGKYTANRLLSLLSTLFAFAMKMEFMTYNPAQGIKKNREEKRERYLEQHEIVRFFAALESEPNEIARDYFLIRLFTGARRSKVAAMNEGEIRLEKGEWYIKDTKSGASRLIPLIPEAIEVVKRRIEANKQNGCTEGWIFPGIGKTGHYQEPRKALERICKKAEIEYLRVHDLRRTLGSWQAHTGASLPVIGKTLGHTQAQTTQIYARLSTDPVKESMAKATQAIFEVRDKEIIADKV